MSNFSLSRRIMVVVAVAAVALGSIALPAAAKGPKGRGQQSTETVTAHAHGKHRADEARQRQRAPKFVVVGFVTSVDTAEITMQVKGGNKSLRKLAVPVAFTVADDARVKLNGERVELSALAAGDHVVVKGVKLGDVLTARKVFASREEEEEEEEVEDSTESDDSQSTQDATTGDATTGDATTGDATTTTP